MPPKRRLRNKEVEPIVHPALEQENAASPDITLEQAKNRIKELEEQLRLMSLQNNQNNNSVLVNQTLDPSKGRSKSVVDSPLARKTRRGSSSVLKKDQNAGCSCSGDCGSKRCGCVKKDKSCSEFCKCTELCKNQVERASQDDEDKENVQIPKKEMKKKGEKNPAPMERVTRHQQLKMLIDEDSSSDGTPLRLPKPKSLFSTPNSEVENRSSSEASPEEERIINPMKPRHQLQRSPPSKDKDTLNNSEQLDVTTDSRSSSPNVSSTNTVTGDEKNASFLHVNSSKLRVSSPSSNPMKPRHKLARSPMAGSSGNCNTRSKSKSPNVKKNTSDFDDDDVFLSVSVADSSKSNSSPPLPPEIFKEEVDWDQHQATLVACRKCQRKFFDYRVEIHEKSCKKI